MTENSAPFPRRHVLFLLLITLISSTGFGVSGVRVRTNPEVQTARSVCLRLNHDHDTRGTRVTEERFTFCFPIAMKPAERALGQGVPGAAPPSRERVEGGFGVSEGTD